MHLEIPLKYAALAICIGLSTFVNVVAQIECETSTSADDCRVDMECGSYTDLIVFNCDDLRRTEESYAGQYCPAIENHWYDNPAGIYLKYNSVLGPIGIFYLSDTLIPRVDDQLKYFIVELELDNHAFTNAPIIESLPNLKTLKLNRNSLVEAKLFNSKHLPSLSELELSHNMIDRFDIHGIFPFSKLTLLNVSNNYLVNIPDATFDFLNSLEKLDLSHNYIDTLGIMTFEGVKQLKFLDLSSNRIHELKFSLMRFGELEELYLDNNRINKLIAEDLNRLENIKILSIRSNTIASLDKNVFSKMLHLSKLDFSFNVIEALDKDCFTDLNELGNIDLSNNKIKTLPPYLFQGKNLLFFGIIGNNLEGHLLRGTFGGLQLMEELNLSYQHLTAVDDYALFGLDAVTSILLNNNELTILSNLSFISLHNLVRLELSNNKITKITFDTKDLIKLESLSMRNNSLSYIGQNDFSELIALQFLDLSMNNISYISSDSFKTLSRLTNFDISNNPLRGTLERSTFDGLVSLPKLDISHTLLSLVKNEAFKGMVTLKELSISYSNINELEFNSFGGAAYIETLDLSFNNLSVFMINNSELNNLKILYLNNNNLISITYHDFEGLVGLSKLVISNNSIQNIDYNAFNDQTDLQYLDISFNTNLTLNMSVLRNSHNLYDLKVSEINKNIKFTNLPFLGSLSTLVVTYCKQTNFTDLDLGNLTQLHNLDLSHNNVKIVDGSAFYGLENLGELNLSFNKITSINPGVFKGNIRLQKLNISHNSLTIISYGIFRGLGYLRFIDISYNHITSLKSERFYELKSLEYLIADHNQVDNIGLDEFSNTNLKNLSIGGNPLACDILVKLKDTPKSFHITSIELDHDTENFDGVSCNNKHDTDLKRFDDSNPENSKKVLQDIRNILLNSSNRYEIEFEIKNFLSNLTKIKSEDTDVYKDMMIAKYLSNIPELMKTEVSYLSNITEILRTEKLTERPDIIKLFNQTNILLSKMLNLNTTSLHDDIIPEKNPKESSLKTDDIIYQLKKNNQDSAVLNKKIFDLENKLNSMIFTQNDSVKKEAFHTVTPNTEKLYLDKQNVAQTSVFTETCVGLMLFIMICFILFKLYKSRYVIPSRRSMSTREIAHSMDNSNL